MSLTAKLVLGAACTFTVGIIGYVHYKQYLDREQLHQGVIKGIERRQKRKMENIYNLQQQIEFTKEMNQRKVNEQNKNLESNA